MKPAQYRDVLLSLRDQFAKTNGISLELEPTSGKASLCIHVVPDGVSYLFSTHGIVETPRFACWRDEVLPHATETLRRAIRAWGGPAPVLS
jgi:hypothetical protein